MTQTVLLLHDFSRPAKKPDEAEPHENHAAQTVKPKAAKQTVREPGQSISPNVASETPPVLPASPAASESPPTAPHIDLDDVRKQILIADRHREISPAERLHDEQFVPQSVEAKMERAAKRGKRGDCQTTYSGMGILAIVPLVIDTATDKGCKWD